MKLAQPLRAAALQESIQEHGSLPPGKELAWAINHHQAQKKVQSRRRGIEFVEGDLISLDDYEQWQG